MGILDNAKEVANAVHEIKNIELYGRVLELHSGIIDLVEDNRKLRDEIAVLKQQLLTKPKMKFQSPAYYQDGDNTPYCSRCWEKESIPIHLKNQWREPQRERWDCPSCQSSFIVEHPSNPWG